MMPFGRHVVVKKPLSVFTTTLKNHGNFFPPKVVPPNFQKGVKTWTNPDDFQVFGFEMYCSLFRSSNKSLDLQLFRYFETVVT